MTVAAGECKVAHVRIVLLYGSLAPNDLMYQPHVACSLSHHPSSQWQRQEYWLCLLR